MLGTMTTGQPCGDGYDKLFAAARKMWGKVADRFDYPAFYRCTTTDILGSFESVDEKREFFSLLRAKKFDEAWDMVPFSMDGLVILYLKKTKARIVYSRELNTQDLMLNVRKVAGVRSWWFLPR